MKRLTLLAFALLALLAAVGTSVAQETTVTGSVISQVGNNLIVKTDGGEIKFFMESDVHVPRQLGTGDRVAVTYKMRDNDKVVTRVALSPATDMTGTTTTHVGRAHGTGPTPSTMSVRGTVVSSDDMALVVRTDEGEKRFVVGTDTSRPTTLQAGDRVEVWHSMRDDDMVATRVTMAPASTTTYERTSLPRTASFGPLIGLAGLLALAGGIALRFYRA